MRVRTLQASVVGLALVATLAWASGLAGRRDLFRPRVAPLVKAAGSVSLRLTGSGRVVEFRLSGLAKRSLYAVRFTEDDHPVLRAARTDRKGRARFQFNHIHLPDGILEPIANRPIEVVTFAHGNPGEQVLVGRLPLVTGFPYWGQPNNDGRTARLPGVDDAGPFDVTSDTFELPTTSGGLASGDTVVWYPGSGGAVAAGGPYPPVVFVHAAQFGASDYQNWGRKIASWGFVVTVLDYTDPAPAPDADPLKPDGQAQVRTTLGAMDRLVAENADPSSRFFGKLDVHAFGFVGHSLGGGVAVVAAARATTQGRVKAVVGLAPEPLFVQSGLFGPYIPYPPDATSGYWPPTLVLSGTRDGVVDPAASRASYFDPAPKPRGVVQVGGHCNVNYADSVPAGAASDYDPSTCDTPAAQQKAARTYVIAWLLGHLRGDERVLDYVNGAYASEQLNVVEESFD